MNCEECQVWMPEFAEGAAPADVGAAVREHMASCSACRDEASRARGLLKAARELPRTEPASEAVLRVSEAIHAAGAPVRRTEFGAVMDVDELADFLRVDRETVGLYIGEIPCFELGGKLLFRRKSVEAWIERREDDMGIQMAIGEQIGETHAAVRPGGVSWTN